MKVDYDDLLISRAMESEKMISFAFKGRKIRKAEPQALIEHKKTKIRYLIAYQTERYSVSGGLGWKAFTLYNVYDVTMLDDDFKIKNVKIPSWANEIDFNQENKGK